MPRPRRSRHRRGDARLDQHRLPGHRAGQDVLNRHTEVSQRVATTRAGAAGDAEDADRRCVRRRHIVHGPGQPLLWKDEKNVTMFTATPASIEAVWSDTGAVCLNEPRRPELGGRSRSTAAGCRGAARDARLRRLPRTLEFLWFTRGQEITAVTDRLARRCRAESRKCSARGRPILPRFGAR